MPPQLFFIALIGEIAVALGVRGGALVPSPWNLSGIALIVVGMVLASGGSQQFARVGTEISPLGTPSQLVTDGVFRWSRNPMYLGMVVLLLGVAIGLGNIWSFAFPPLLGLLLDRRVVRMEEAKMAGLFGEDYERYRGRVRRWI